MNELKEIEKMLKDAHGEITIKVNGLTPDIEGDFNQGGAFMIVLSAMMLLEMTKITDSWEETIVLINELHEIKPCEAVVHESKREKRKNDNR